MTVEDAAVTAEAGPAGAVGLRRSRATSWRAPAAVAAVATVLLAGVALRFLPAGPLWFDESQSVAIARLPLAGLLHALRQDGSPPLYYLLLHGWMSAVGSGTWAVRALSGLCSVATLPVAGVLAARVLGRSARWPAVLVLASSPFAIRFATETRMYSLVILLVACGGVALHEVWVRPSWPRVVGLSVVSGLLALTHYWALFLLAAVGVALAWRAVRGSARAARALVGVLGGAVLFAPWAPSLLFQIRHTGTPWAHARWFSVLQAIPSWAGALRLDAPILVPSLALMPVLLALVVVGARRSRAGRRQAALTAATLAIAGGVSVALGSAVVPRYTSVALLPYLLAAAAGAAALGRTSRRAALAGVTALGLVAGFFAASAPRTHAREVAGILQQAGSRADVVVYCPDQLGPDVGRLLPGWPHQLMYPDGRFPHRVDWVDYRQRNLASSPARFVHRLQARYPGRRIWLLKSTGFVEYGGRCAQLADDLAGARPDHRRYALGGNPMDSAQREMLIRYAPNRGEP